MSRTWADRARSLVWRSMDTPGLRAPLSLLCTGFCSWRAHAPCWVIYDSVWVHRFPDGVVCDLRIRQNVPQPARFRRVTQDIFLYEFQPGPGDVVVDVGAGIGAETFTIAPLVGSTGHVYAIEAHPRTFRCLETMVRLNRFPNVTVDAMAIAENEGEVRIEDEADGHISNAVVTGSEGSLTVPATTLDHYVQRRRIDRIDLLKMNIEGAEVGALRSGPNALKMTRHVVVSCHDFKADRTGEPFFRTKEAVRGMLREAGFETLERTDESRPWVRDTVYGWRASEPARGPGDG